VFNNSADAMKLIAILLRVEEQIRSVEHFAIRLKFDSTRTLRYTRHCIPPWNTTYIQNDLL